MQTTKTKFFLILMALFSFQGCLLIDEPLNNAKPESWYVERFEYLNNIQAYDEAEDVIDEMEANLGLEEEAAIGRSLLTVNRVMTHLTDIVMSMAVIVDVSFQIKSQYSVTDLFQENIRIAYAEINGAISFLEKTIKKYPVAALKLDGFNLYVGTVPLYILHAEIDTSDIHVFLIGANVFKMLGALLLSVEWGLNVSDLPEILGWFSDREDCVPNILSATGTCFAAFGSWLLRRFPKLLETNKDFPEYGDEMKQAWIGLFGSIENMLQSVGKEVDDQSDDLVQVFLDGDEFSKIAPNQHLLKISNYNYAGWIDYFARTVRTDRVFVSPAEVESEVRVVFSDKSVNANRLLLDNLENGGPPIDLWLLMDSIIEVVAPLFVNEAIINSFAAILLSKGNSYISEEDAQQLDAMRILRVLFRDFIPEGLAAVDLHAAFENPIGFRYFLPYYDYAPSWANGSEVLAIDWECRFGKVSSFMLGTCAESPKDQVMFAGYPYEMTSDDFPEVREYIAFQTPDFGKVLYVDTSKVPATEVTHSLPGSLSGLRMSTNESLNFVFHRIIDKAESILSPFNK